MRLGIGLIARSSTWEQICLQEGVPYVYVDVTARRIESLCSLLVVNRILTSGEKSVVEEYLHGGGAVIGYTQHLLKVAGIEGTDLDLSYIISDNDIIFPSIHLLDLGVKGMIPRGANALRTDTNTFAVLAGALGGGFAVVLPFECDMLLHDARQADKSFHFNLDRLPSERVSLVAKGELRQLVHGAFKYLHHVRGMPYAHLWYFPRDLRSVFAFRIDTDGASREEIDTLYELGRDHDVSMSWFLDTKSHEQWLDHFAYFVAQEMGLHCYEHHTYPGYDANLKNITHGLQLMRHAGLHPAGFTSPYGVWSPGLAKAVDKAGLEFSSEFSYAYDTLPLFPEAGEDRFGMLQVPIHPICVGSMLRVGYSDTRMVEYFQHSVRQKLCRQEPLFFYHHPSHRHLDVVRSLFSIREEKVENMTLGAYARWWRRRIGVKLSLEVERDVIRIQSDGSPVPEEVWIRVIRPGGDETILSFGESIDLQSVTRWTVSETPVPPPDDIRRTREFDPRQMAGALYNTLIRKLR